ncbi:hypothetical protein ACEYYB_07405 [Paracoccus sp. p4-l81]|uniref:hypothetical protein n=1 Tax=unclassified Paracoccus (in: a-proteobacteria) TaxID=2688777 RepID=UPI0035B87954
MTRLAFLAPVALIALTACAPAPAPTTVVVADPAAGAAPVVPVTQIAGVQERAPDLCKGSSYVGSLGQPGSVIPGLGITREYRVVQWRGIEPQDYNPARIVFRLDAAGNIYNIDCG